jgi:hypothetical protein
MGDDLEFLPTVRADERGRVRVGPVIAHKHFSIEHREDGVIILRELAPISAAPVNGGDEDGHDDTAE